MDENTVVKTPEGQAPQGDATGVGVQNVATDAPETGVKTGAAAPQEKSEAERFAFALKQRTLEEKAKLEKALPEKYALDLKLAQEVRRTFAGKDDTAIVSDLLDARAKVFATENGISEALARKFIELERATAAVAPEAPAKKAESAPATAQVSDAWLARLAHQREAIQNAHGVDVLEGITAEEEAQVMKGELDLNEVFAVRSKAATPPPVNRGASKQAGTPDFKHMSEAEYEAFRETLRKEGTIPIRSD